jgi:general secretion pathway protein D
MNKTGMWIALCVTALPLVAQESSKAPSTGVDVADLIGRYAKRSGKQFVIDPRVRAQVPLAGIDPGQLTQEQLFTILDVNSIAVVEYGGMFLVLPDAGARQFATAVYTDPKFKARDHEIVTLLIQPKKACAAHMVPVLRPLMPQPAHLAAELQSNTLMINDRAANVRRIAGLVQELDSRSRGDHANCDGPRKSE